MALLLLLLSAVNREELEAQEAYTAADVPEGTSTIPDNKA